MIALLRHEVRLLIRNRMVIVAVVALILTSAISITMRIPVLRVREGLPNATAVAVLGAPTAVELARDFGVRFLDPMAGRGPQLVPPRLIRRYYTLDLFYGEVGRPGFSITGLLWLHLVLLPIFGIFIGVNLLKEDQKLRLALCGLPLHPSLLIIGKIAVVVGLTAMPFILIFVYSLGILATMPAGIQGEVVQRLGYFYLAGYVYLLAFTAIGLMLAALVGKREIALMGGMIAVLLSVAVVPGLEAIVELKLGWMFLGPDAGMIVDSEELPLGFRLLSAGWDLARWTPTATARWIYAVALNPETSQLKVMGPRPSGGIDVNFPVARARGVLAPLFATLALWGGTFFAGAWAAFSLKKKEALS